MIYVGKDSSEIKKLLSKIPTRCIIARRSESDFGFAVTNSKNTKYNILTKVLKLHGYTPTSYEYIRGIMSVTATKTDRESGDVSGGIIELRVFEGENFDELPKESKMKKTAEVSNIIIKENEEIPNSYTIEFRKSASTGSRAKSP